MAPFFLGADSNPGAGAIPDGQAIYIAYHELKLMSN